MLKIKRFNNVYGIKEIKNPDLITGNTIIYAPNGVMKTSFSDGIRDIISGIRPRDVFSITNLESTFQLENNGKNISSTDSNFTIDAFVFNTENYSDDIFADPRIGSLVMSNVLKLKYKDSLDSFKKAKQQFISIISKDVLGKKKVDENDLFILSDVFGTSDFIEIISKLLDLKDYQDDYYRNLNYDDFFNDKVSNIIESSDFIQKCNDYNSYIDAELDKEVFKLGFDFEALSKIHAELSKNNFFNAGHKIHLNTKEEMGEQELSNYLKEIIQKVYGTTEAQKLFNVAKSSLNKNAQTRKLLSIINSDPRHLKELAKPAELKKNIIFSKLSNFENQIQNFQKEILAYKLEMEKIVKEAEQTTETWKKVLADYNSRFISNKFDVEIENLTDAVLDVNPPIFKRKIKGTNQEITTEIFQRFSSGEKRAVMILNLMFEVELRKNENFALVLDDISDSFDYKNKYAIIECLKDFSDNQNIQLIILTHNFDFYRSLRISLKDKIDSKLLAYSNNGIVTLYDAKSSHFEDYSYYSNWKNNGNEIDVLAIIPFLRNIIQLESNSKDPEYVALTKLLHYDDTLDSKRFVDFLPILSAHAIKISFDSQKMYLDTVKGIAQDIILNSAIKETDLREKIVLGIYIRLFSDKFMWKRYVKIFGINPNVENILAQSKFLYNQISNDLTVEERKTLLTAFTIAPSFIHINSFMYEPLVDVGTEKLIEVANEIISL